MLTRFTLAVSLLIILGTAPPTLAQEADAPPAPPAETTEQQPQPAPPKVTEQVPPTEEPKAVAAPAAKPTPAKKTAKKGKKKARPWEELVPPHIAAEIRIFIDIDQSRKARGQAAKRLGKMGPVIIPYMKTLLKANNKDVRGYAAWALRHIDTEEARQLVEQYRIDALKRWN